MKQTVCRIWIDHSQSIDQRLVHASVFTRPTFLTLCSSLPPMCFRVDDGLIDESKMLSKRCLTAKYCVKSRYLINGSRIGLYKSWMMRVNQWLTTGQDEGHSESQAGYTLSCRPCACTYACAMVTLHACVRAGACLLVGNHVGLRNPPWLW